MQDAIPLDPFTLEALSEAVAGRAVAELAAAVAGLLRDGRTMKKAWTHQDSKQVKKHGAEAASWYVSFIDPDGKRCCKSYGPGERGKKLAEQEAERVGRELEAGTYRTKLNATWAEFRREYADKILSGHSLSGREQAIWALDNFERIARPRKVSGVKTQTVDAYTAARRAELKRDSTTETVKESTVNAGLRNLKAALKVAREWGYLAEMPVVRLLKEPRKLPVYVTPDDFAALYRAADRMTMPWRLQGCTPGDWWRALLVFVYQGTGWRVGQCMALLWEDVDLYDTGTVLGRAGSSGNKARSEVRVKLHPVTLEHLAKVRGFGPKVFPWPHHETTLRHELSRLCDLAGVRHYNWHSLRKGFGTLNAPRMSAVELQHCMQHASLATTQRYYLNGNAWRDETAAKLYVPDVLKRDAG